MQTVGDKTVISGLRWSVPDRYGLLIMVGCVGGVRGDFSQTALKKRIKLKKASRMVTLSQTVTLKC